MTEIHPSKCLINCQGNMNVLVFVYSMKLILESHAERDIITYRNDSPNNFSNLLHSNISAFIFSFDFPEKKSFILWLCQKQQYKQLQGIKED